MEYEWGSKETYLKTNSPKGKDPSKSYENAKLNVLRLNEQRKKIESKLVISASYVISEWNYDDVINAAILGKETGIDNLFFRPDMMPMNSRSEEPLDIISNNKEILLKSKAYENDNYKIHIEHERENDSLITQNKELVCFCSNHSIMIAANGDVYPCCYTRINKKYVIGNISNQKFENFWKDKNNCEHYKTLNINSCPTCPYANVNETLTKVYNNDKIVKQKQFDKLDYFV